jgi:hypothetical protein
MQLESFLQRDLTLHNGLQRRLQRVNKLYGGYDRSKANGETRAKDVQWYIDLRVAKYEGVPAS